MTSRRFVMMSFFACLAACGESVSCPEAEHPAGDGSCSALGDCANGFVLNESGDCAEPDRAIVRILEWSTGNAVAGIDIAFHDADGAVVSYAKTSADGLASAELPAPGWVTIAVHLPLENSPTIHRLYTRPIGTEQAIDFVVQTGSSAGFEDGGTVAVTLPSAAPEGTIAQVVGTGAGQGAVDSSPTLLSLSKPYVNRRDSTSVVAQAFDAAGELTGYSIVENVDLLPLRQSGGTVSVTLPDWQLQLQDTSVQITGGQPDLEGGVFASAMIDGEFYFIEDYVAGPAGAGITGSLKLPNEIREVTITDSLRTEDMRTASWRYTPSVALPETYSVDLDREILPLIENYATEDVDSARPRAHWDWSSAAHADMASVFFSAGGGVAGTDPDVDFYSWSLEFPGDARRDVRAPSLPPNFSEYLPSGSWRQVSGIDYIDAESQDDFETTYQQNHSQISRDGSAEADDVKAIAGVTRDTLTRLPPLAE